MGIKSVSPTVSDVFPAMNIQEMRKMETRTDLLPTNSTEDAALRTIAPKDGNADQPRGVRRVV